MVPHDALQQDARERRRQRVTVQLGNTENMRGVVTFSLLIRIKNYLRREILLGKCKIDG